MFLVMITYTSLEKVDQYLEAHRAYLDIGYQQDFLVASGPRKPRTGGVILSQLKDRKQLEHFLAEDPFLLHDAARYEIIEFDPVKFHADFASFAR